MKRPTCLPACLPAWCLPEASCCWLFPHACLLNMKGRALLQCVLVCVCDVGPLRSFSQRSVRVRALAAVMGKLETSFVLPFSFPSFIRPEILCDC